jgi:phosphate transport system permease protein
LGIFSAAYLSEMAPKKLQMILKPIIEMLAAIPSVAIGFLGIVLVGPGLAHIFGIQNGLNALNGSILLAVMALPTIVTISEDASMLCQNLIEKHLWLGRKQMGNTI